jgi:hypothetical protein
MFSRELEGVLGNDRLYGLVVVVFGVGVWGVVVEFDLDLGGVLGDSRLTGEVVSVVDCGVMVGEMDAVGVVMLVVFVVLSVVVLLVVELVV